MMSRARHLKVRGFRSHVVAIGLAFAIRIDPAVVKPVTPRWVASTARVNHKEGRFSSRSGYCAGLSRCPLVTPRDIPVALTAFGVPNDIE
jgi:hypothetical protein